MNQIEQTSVEIETLQIAELEYDIGGVSSVEAAAGRQSNDSVVIWYVTPN